MPSKAGYGSLSPTISITSKSAQVLTPATSTSTPSKRPIGKMQYWLAIRNCIGEKTSFGLPNAYQVFLGRILTSDPRSNIVFFIWESATWASILNSFPDILLLRLTLWLRCSGRFTEIGRSNGSSYLIMISNLFRSWVESCSLPKRKKAGTTS